MISAKQTERSQGAQPAASTAAKIESPGSGRGQCQPAALGAAPDNFKYTRRLLGGEDAGERGLPPYFRDEERWPPAHAAHEILDSGISIYTGAYPLWPFSGIESEWLPWWTKYWREEERAGQIYFTRAGHGDVALGEIVAVADALWGVDWYAGAVDIVGAVWFCPALMQSQETTVQAMAVQVIACAEASLVAIDESDYINAGAHLARAYDNLFLAHIECESLVKGRHPVC